MLKYLWEKVWKGRGEKEERDNNFLGHRFKNKSSDKNEGCNNGVCSIQVSSSQEAKDKSTNDSVEFDKGRPSKLVQFMLAFYDH
jgi:hypothetical protein